MSGSTREQEAYLRALRRDRIQSLLALGKNQHSIARGLNIPLSTVNSDVKYLRQYAQNYLKRFESNILVEYKRCLDLLTEILSESWQSARDSRYERNKAALLNVAKDCLALKVALLSDITLIDRASSFIEKHKRKRLHIDEDNEDEGLSEFRQTYPEEDDKLEVPDGDHAF